MWDFEWFNVQGIKARSLVASLSIQLLVLASYHEEVYGKIPYCVILYRGFYFFTIQSIQHPLRLDDTIELTMLWNHQSTPERGWTAQNDHTSYAKRIT
jgi:hypothetical protein